MTWHTHIKEGTKERPRKRYWRASVHFVGSKDLKNLFPALQNALFDWNFGTIDVYTEKSSIPIMPLSRTTIPTLYWPTGKTNSDCKDLDIAGALFFARKIQ